VRYVSLARVDPSVPNTEMADAVTTTSAAATSGSGVGVADSDASGVGEVDAVDVLVGLGVDGPPPQAVSPTRIRPATARTEERAALI
jgi:hypothetical protein